MFEIICILCPIFQVSDTPPGEEDYEGSGLFEGSGMFEGSGAEEEGSGLEDGGEDDDEEGPMYYFLEESTGYMEPAMAFFGIIHTIISFLCIIGYNCLKVCTSALRLQKSFHTAVGHLSQFWFHVALSGPSGYLQERERAGQETGVRWTVCHRAAGR